MTLLRRWPVLAALSFAALFTVLSGPGRLNAQPLQTGQQPDGGGGSETPGQLCRRCKGARDACKTACAGPNGTGIPSDSCLERCDNSYWGCIPAGVSCADYR